MVKPKSLWAVTQFGRLAEQDPERADRLLEALWEAHPNLLSELAISAVASDELSIEECARVMMTSADEVEKRLSLSTSEGDGAASLILVDGGVARLADARVCVWEIVRELRRHGSVECLCESYPGLTKVELEAALAYAASNTEEVEALITRYEGMLERRRAEYPYAQ
jgi:uncharacterized protein (DUF433 family)